METVWKEYIKKGTFGALETDIERDVVIVGGGIAGLLAGYRLSERGRRVTLVEGGELLNGVTRGTTAHIEALQGVKYSELGSKEAAVLYYRSQIEAIDAYEELVNKYNIDCSFRRLDSYLYAESDDADLKKEFAALKNIGADVEFIENAELIGGRVQSAIKMPRQACFDPIAFMNGLPINLEVFENTRITDIDFADKLLSDGRHTIRAQKIIIATNFPIKDVPGFYFLRMYKSSSYAAAIEGAEDIGGFYQDDGESGCTFRSYGDKLIVGGLDHRTGRVDACDKYQTLVETASRRGFSGEPREQWSANDCITFDALPFVGYYSKTSQDFYIISGFNKWGIANAMTAAKLIADLISGEGNPYERLFSPLRRVPINLEFFRNLLCVVKNLVVKPLLPALRCYKTLKPGEGDIVNYKGAKKAVYKDESGKLFICEPLCAHLHCQLTFNPVDKTWDCPCHGSRFDIHGKIICAPTVEDLKTFD